MEEWKLQRQFYNKALLDYMSRNGYQETLECFKREADFPDESEPEAASEELRVEEGSLHEHPHPNSTSACSRFPWFLVTMSIVQFCIHLYMVISKDDRQESPLIIDPFR